MRTYCFDASAADKPVPGAPIGLALREDSLRSPSSGNVQVRVRANALNFVDLISFSGAFPVDGRVPLLDGAGEVLAVGDGVNGLVPGDRVVANPHASWVAGAPANGSIGMVLGITVDGMLGEVVELPETALVKLPPTIGFEAGAALPCAGLSAWNSLRGGPARYAVTPGSTILTQGTGGVSLFAVQFAKAMGCRVIATTSSAAKAEKLKQLGADEVVNYIDTPEWGQRVLELTGGVGVDLVVEVGGPNTIGQSILAASIGGRIAMVGVVAGMGSIDYSDMLAVNHKVLTLFANGMGSRRDLEEMLRFVATQNLTTQIDAIFPFERASEAIRHFAERRHIGKVVISHDT